MIKYVEFEGDNVIVIGNNRYMAAKHLGILDQLRFERVEFPVPGTNFETPGDIPRFVNPPRYWGR